MSKQSIVRAIKPSRFSFTNTLGTAFSVFAGPFTRTDSSSEDRMLSRAANDAAQR